MPFCNLPDAEMQPALAAILSIQFPTTQRQLCRSWGISLLLQHPPQTQVHPEGGWVSFSRPLDDSANTGEHHLLWIHTQRGGRNSGFPHPEKTSAFSLH